MREGKLPKKSWRECKKELYDKWANDLDKGE